MYWFSANAGEWKKIIYNEILGKPWDVAGVDMFTLHNKCHLHIADYNSQFPVIKKMEDLSADSIILAYKIMFSEYGLPKKIMSDPGGNFISDKFKRFYHSMDIEQAVSLSYHQQGNGHIEVCIKFLSILSKMHWY